MFGVLTTISLTTGIFASFSSTPFFASFAFVEGGREGEDLFSDFSSALSTEGVLSSPFFDFGGGAIFFSILDRLRCESKPVALKGPRR